MGKAAKRERQKTNRVLKTEEAQRAEAKAKTIKAAKIIGLVLVIPVILVATLFINKATDPDVYTAKITVAIDGVKNLPNNGVIELELDQANAPKSYKHFAAYASNGLYDGMSWHRVVEDFVIQSGDPKGDGTGALGSTILAELPKTGYTTGDFAWAKGGNDPAGTAGSQFFIVTGNEKSEGLKALNTKAPQPDGSNKYQYGYIGHVTKGLDAAIEIEKLAPADPADVTPVQDAKILKIEVFKNGKLIKRGDLVPATTTSTTTTTAPVGVETSAP